MEPGGRWRGPSSKRPSVLWTDLSLIAQDPSCGYGGWEPSPTRQSEPPFKVSSITDRSGVTPYVKKTQLVSPSTSCAHAKTPLLLKTGRVALQVQPAKLMTSLQSGISMDFSLVIQRDYSGLYARPEQQARPAGI